MKVLKSGISILFAFFLALSLFCIPACSDSDHDVFNQGTRFNIGITDIPCTDLFTAVNVTFSSFVIQNVTANEQIELVPTGGPVTINLLDYLNPNAFIIPFEIPPGTYKMVSMTIDAVAVTSDMLTPEQVQAINDMLLTFMPITFDFGNVIPNPTFTVPADMETTVIIDINCNDSILEDGGTYSFEPIAEIVDIVHR